MSMVLPSNSRHKIDVPSRVTLPEELIIEILSLFNVKSLTQFKCVSKSWNSIISDSFFVKMHLDKSSRIPHVGLFFSHHGKFVSLHIFPISCLLENPYIFKNYSKYQLMKLRPFYNVIGSCNGLICLLSSCKNEFHLWNPATKVPFSENLGSFPLSFQHKKTYFRFSFGYDNLTNKYKLVAFSSKEVRVFTFGHNVWKNIQFFPAYPYHYRKNNGVYLSNSLNWFALLNNKCFYNKDLNVEELVIISLDLATETYTQFQLPREFDEVPYLPPIVCKLLDSLCFYHYTKDGGLVIWQMKEFGVEKSWTKFLQFDYHSLFDCSGCTVHLLPLHVFENGDMLILEINIGHLSRYNRRDNEVVKTTYIIDISLSASISYVESLVSTF